MEIPTKWEAGWVLEPVWAFWRRGKSVAVPGILTPNCQPAARSLYRLSYSGCRCVTFSFFINFKIHTIFKKYVPTASKHCVSIINKIKVKVKFTL